MKKRFICLLLAVCAVSTTACGKTTAEPTINTSTDTKDSTNNQKITFDYYELDDGTLEIQGYDNEDKIKKVEIPDTIEGKKVSVLNLGLFRSNDVVEEIILPESLKVIEKETFYGAIALRKLEIKGIETLGENAISGCPEIKELEFPDGLKTIERMGISHCESLTDVYLPETVESIDEMNFGLCADGLKIHVPKGSNTAKLVNDVVANLEYNVQVVEE